MCFLSKIFIHIVNSAKDMLLFLNFLFSVYQKFFVWIFIDSSPMNHRMCKREQPNRFFEPAAQSGMAQGWWPHPQNLSLLSLFLLHLVKKWREIPHLIQSVAKVSSLEKVCLSCFCPSKWQRGTVYHNPDHVWPLTATSHPAGTHTVVLWEISSWVLFEVPRLKPNLQVLLIFFFFIFLTKFHFYV